ncbi:MAG: hypothetical protein AB7O04_09150 [Hyphomonadaceae bacterium]
MHASLADWLAIMFGKGKTPSGNEMLQSRVKKVAGRAFGSGDGAAKNTGSKKERPRREAVFRSAALIFGNDQRLIVAIKDVSEAGARIEYFGCSLLPETFILSEPTLKLRRRVRVVWQREGVAGLIFID